MSNLFECFVFDSHQLIIGLISSCFLDSFPLIILSKNILCLRARFAAFTTPDFLVELYSAFVLVATFLFISLFLFIFLVYHALVLYGRPDQTALGTFLNKFNTYVIPISRLFLMISL